MNAEMLRHERSAIRAEAFREAAEVAENKAKNAAECIKIENLTPIAHAQASSWLSTAKAIKRQILDLIPKEPTT